MHFWSHIVAITSKRLTLWRSVATASVASFVAGLILNPATGIFFVPTAGGLFFAAIMGAVTGLLFYIAYVVGHLSWPS